MPSFTKYFDKKRRLLCWRFDVTIAGQRYRHGGFAKKKDAEEALANLHLMAQRMRYGLPLNLAEATIGELQAELNKDGSVPSRVRWIFDLFVQRAGSRQSIRGLSRADIKSFADYLKESRTLSDGSYRLYLERLRAALNRAGDYFSELETWKAPKFPKLPSGNRRIRTVKKEELAAFLAELKKDQWPHDRPGTYKTRNDLYDIIRLMLLIGARREEIEKIEAKSINADEKTLLLWSSKTKKHHLIPLSDTALKILLERQPTKTGRLWKAPLLTSFVTRTMQRAGRQAGLPFGRKDAWTVHDVRRTASVVIERAGISYSAIQDLLGHSRREATANYTPAQWDELTRAVKELENWCRDIDNHFGAFSEIQASPATSHLRHIA